MWIYILYALVDNQFLQNISYIWNCKVTTHHIFTVNNIKKIWGQIQVMTSAPTSTMKDVVSHATPLNGKDRGVWWPCVRVVLTTKSGCVQSDSRFEFIAKQHLACSAYGRWCYFCGCLRCLLQLLHSTSTTRCTHGHQIPLSLWLRGVVCETNRCRGFCYTE